MIVVLRNMKKFIVQNNISKTGSLNLIQIYVHIAMNLCQYSALLLLVFFVMRATRPNQTCSDLIEYYKTCP